MTLYERMVKEGLRLCELTDDELREIEVGLSGLVLQARANRVAVVTTDYPDDEWHEWHKVIYELDDFVLRVKDARRYHANAQHKVEGWKEECPP